MCIRNEDANSYTRLRPGIRLSARAARETSGGAGTRVADALRPSRKILPERPVAIYHCNIISYSFIFQAEPHWFPFLETMTKKVLFLQAD